MEYAKITIARIIIFVLLLDSIGCSNSNVSELNQKLQQKDEEYARLKNDFQSTQELNDKQYEELISIHKGLAKLDSLSINLRHDVEINQRGSVSLQKEIDSLIISIKQNIENKSNLIKSQANKEDKLQILLGELTTQLKSKELEINQLKVVVNNQGKTISLQNDSISHLQNSKNEMGSYIHGLEINISQLELKKRQLEERMKSIEAKAYYDIGTALTNAELSIPILNGIFISDSKKMEILNTKRELKNQASFYLKKAADLGYR